MSAKVIDGKSLAALVAQGVASRIKANISRIGRAPRLVVLRVGEDAASKVYVGAKIKAGAEIGINVTERHFLESVSQKELEREFSGIEVDSSVDGLIVQQPLPPGLNINQILAAADPRKDVDGVGFFSTAKRLAGEAAFLPCTPAGVLLMIDWALAGMTGLPSPTDLAGKHAVVIGRSGIVGRPMGELLLKRNATVTMVHSKTARPDKIAVQADIVIAACGVQHLVKREWIKPGAIVIDVGISRIEADTKLHGDVDFEGVSQVAGFISPVPGGVGPMTVAMLMSNVVDAWLRR